MLFKQGFHFKPSPQAIYTYLLYGHEVKIYVDVVNKCVILYTRMKTANDFNKHLEKFRSGMSAGNILRLHAVIRKGLVMYLYTNKSFRHCHRSDFSGALTYL